MKRKRIAITLLIALLLAGCNFRAAGQQLNRAEDRLDQIGDNIEDAVEGALYGDGKTNTPTTPTTPQTRTATLTPEEAQAIALEHAGFTADQVSCLYAEYEIDDRIPQYDVRFRQGYLEYDYEIHAETGEILSFERDG